MSMYYIKTGLEYWKPKGYGYTKSREEAGVFTLKDMEELNLDGCTLERAEVAFLDEDGPSPDLPHPGGSWPRRFALLYLPPCLSVGVTPSRQGFASPGAHPIPSASLQGCGFRSRP